MQHKNDAAHHDDRRFVALMCGSTACRLGEAGFLERFDELRKSFNDDQRFVALMCGGLACRLGDPGKAGITGNPNPNGG